MQRFLQDLRHGLRLLAKNPGFSSIAIITLALGIGANTAIYGIVHAALLRPLPYQDPGRLVYVWSAEKARGISQSTVSIPDLRDWRQQNSVFDGLAGWWSGSYNLSGGDQPVEVNGWTVSPSFFDVFGARPEFGRTFTTNEDQAADDRAVVLSHSLWVSAFGRDPRIVGRTVMIDSEPRTVIGVMPAAFSSPFSDIQLWLLWPPTVETTASRGDRFLRVMGRLKPGLTIVRAQANMDTIARRLSQTYRDDTGVTTYLVPAEQQITGNVRPALLVLLGAVGFVLLIACANVANLLLVRSAARQTEFAMRAALGASRSQILYQLLTESVLLSILGGGAGVLLAACGVRYLRLLLASQIPRAQEIGLDARVLLFTLGLSVTIGLAVGLFPAWLSFRGGLNEVLKAGGRSRSSGRSGRRVRDFLVICEMALALVLLAGAGLLINSFERLRAVDPGFDPDKVLTCRISLPSKYKNPEVAAFYRQLLERLRGFPVVKAAGATMTMPLRQSGGGFWGGLNVEGHPAATRESIPIVSFVQVTPGYFRAMGIPLLKGREFTESDNSSQSSKVVIINHTLAHRFFSDGNPVGRRICMGENCSRGPWLSVVGVVGDAALESLTDPRFPQVFSPQAQGVEGGVASTMELALRTSSDPLTLANAVKSAVHELDQNQAVAEIQTLNQVLSASLARPRFNTLLLMAFAALALTLAGVGVYGVISYAVVMRTREIGVRLAFGATRRDVLRLMIRQGMSLALTGAAVGLAGSLILARLMSSLLYGVRPNDPPTFFAAFAVLVGVAFFASHISARRATTVDPMAALRQE